MMFTGAEVTIGLPRCSLPGSEGNTLILVSLKPEKKIVNSPDMAPRIFK